MSSADKYRSPGSPNGASGGIRGVQSMQQTQPLPFPHVQQSWILAGERANIGSVFYENLFAAHPDLKETLFLSVHPQQSMNLVKSITTVLGMLGDMPKAVEMLQQLGARHVAYGTEPAHYPVVGANLIKTLKQILGRDWTEAAEKEWGVLYKDYVQKTMIDAAQSPLAAPHWKRLYKKRLEEFKNIADRATNWAFTPLAFARKVANANEDVAKAVAPCFGKALDDATAQADIAPLRKAAIATAATGALDHDTNLANDMRSRLLAAFATTSKAEFSKYEVMVIAWFAEQLQSGFVMGDAVQDHAAHASASTGNRPYPLCSQTFKRAVECDIGTKFYANMFAEGAPTAFLRNLHFHGVSIVSQRMNIVRFIQSILDTAGTPKADAILHASGLRHIVYGCLDEEYKLVGGNLLKTLSDIFGADLTEDIKSEWKNFYVFMSSSMLAAAHAPESGPYWKRFWKKRVDQVRAIFERVGSVTYDPENFAQKILAGHDLRAARALAPVLSNALDAASTHSDIAPVVKAAAAAARFVDERARKELHTRMVTVLGKKEKMGPHDQWILGWFVDRIHEGFDSSNSGSGSSGSGNNTSTAQPDTPLGFLGSGALNKAASGAAAAAPAAAAGAVPLPSGNHASGNHPYPICVATFKTAVEHSFGTKFYANMFADGAPTAPFRNKHFRSVVVASQSMDLTRFIQRVLDAAGTPAAEQILRASGLRHIGIGCVDEEYRLVGGNLMHTLAQIFGADLTEEIRNEWLRFFDFMASSMIAAAHAPESGPYWKRFWKKRVDQVRAIFERAGSLTYDAEAFAQKVIAGHDPKAARVLAPVFSSALDDAAAQADIAPLHRAAAAASMVLDARAKSELHTRLVGLIGKKERLNEFDLWVLEWFTQQLTQGFSNPGSQTSSVDGLAQQQQQQQSQSQSQSPQPIERRQSLIPTVESMFSSPEGSFHEGSRHRTSTHPPQQDFDAHALARDHSNSPPVGAKYTSREADAAMTNPLDRAGLSPSDTGMSTPAFGGGGGGAPGTMPRGASLTNLDATDNMSALGGTDIASEEGDGDDDANPIFRVIIEVMRKSRMKKRQMANGGSGSGTGTGSPSGSPSFVGMASFDSPAGLGESSAFAAGGGSGGFGESPTTSEEPRHHVMIAAQLRRNAHDALSSMNQYLQSNSARALIIADPINDVIHFANEAAQRLFGRLDLVGQELEVLMPDEIATKHKGLVSAYVDRYHHEHKLTGQPCASRLLDITGERHLKVVRMFNGRPNEFHVNAWVRTLRMPGEDLSEPPRLMAMEAFDAQQYHEDSQASTIFRASLEGVSDGVVIADFSGNIEWINTAMETLGGYPMGMITTQRSTVNIFLPPEMHSRHDGYLAHFRESRKNLAATMQAKSQQTVLPARRVIMKTSYGSEPVLVRVDVAFNRLIGYMKSTREFIPREEFETERLKLLLPAAIVKLMRGSPSSAITSHFWEFEHASVLFTDVYAFSTWARNRPVKVVHDRMQPMFAEFEEIIQAFGGELIHRIGDAVMAIFGFNGEERHHARYALACAVELQQWALSNDFMVRIGVHSGPIGAGIYGSAKGRPGFDAWGPVVNTAKRLEAYGAPGAVHISMPVVKELGHKFSGEVHQHLEETRLEDVKGVDASLESYLLRVNGTADSNHVALPERVLQLVGFQRARYARWKIQNEETERRLMELQRAMR